MVILTFVTVVFAAASAIFFYRQLGDTHAQLQVTQQEFEASQKTARLEQRAWVEPTLVQEKLVKGQVVARPNAPVLVFVRQTNTGKVPAWNVNSEFIVDIVEANQSPSFDYKRDHFGNYGGVLYPSGKFDLSVPWLLPGSTVENPTVLSKPTYDRLMMGQTYIVIFGKLSYTDAYGDHAQQWCTWWAYKTGLDFHAKACVDYNQLSPN